MWSSRFFDYVVIKAENFGLEADVHDILVFSYDDGKYYALPFQVDEVDYRKGEKRYVKGNGVFDGKDELVFPARYCGKKIKNFPEFENLFEIELYDSTEKRYCYVGIGKKFRDFDFVNLPSEGLEIKKVEDEFVVFQDTRQAVFDDERPVIKSIKAKDGDEFKEVFFGLKMQLFIELFGLIEITKTEKDVYAKTLFIKSGPVRVIRVIRPYADIGFGIKIPGADTVSYIYKGFTYVENAVPIPFNLKYISRKAKADIYLNFLRPKRFVSKENDIALYNRKKTEAYEEGHMWGYIESDFWSAAYFIKELTPIPIKRALYYKDNEKILEVGITLDLLDLPKGEHKFALYGFFMPPGDFQSAKKVVFDPLRIKIYKIH